MRSSWSRFGVASRRWRTRCACGGGRCRATSPRYLWAGRTIPNRPSVRELVRRERVVRCPRAAENDTDAGASRRLRSRRVGRVGRCLGVRAPNRAARGFEVGRALACRLLRSGGRSARRMHAGSLRGRVRACGAVGAGARLGRGEGWARARDVQMRVRTLCSDQSAYALEAGVGVQSGREAGRDFQTGPCCFISGG